MEKFILRNGVKLIYEHRLGNLTSFTIGFNAGAIEEEGFNLGVAHAVEHMVSKGTATRSETEINRQCHQVFGFENAMTNYPYAIYYGTALSQDFSAAIDLMADMVMNAAFPEAGFQEEMNVIVEEISEWKDDAHQHCEDMAFFNGFRKRRIKELIIGSEDSVKAITLDELKRFYDEFYTPENCVVSVVSSLELGDVLKTVEKCFEAWSKNKHQNAEIIYEDNVPGVFKEANAGIQGAKVLYAYPVHSLNDWDMKVLKLFNNAFGEGTNSILYEELRTNNGLVYDVSSTVKSEKGIKMFNIAFGTRKENVDKAMELVDSTIQKIKTDCGRFNDSYIQRIAKNMKVKREIALEKSLVLSMQLTTNELMFGHSDKVYRELENLDAVTKEDVLKVACKVLNNPTVQIIMPE